MKTNDEIVKILTDLTNQDTLDWSGHNYAQLGGLTYVLYDDGHHSQSPKKLGIITDPEGIRVEVPVLDHAVIRELGYAVERQMERWETAKRKEAAAVRDKYLMRVNQLMNESIGNTSE